MTTTTTPSPSPLATRWAALKAATPHLRTRDAAAELGVSEAELVATMLGTVATRLDTDAAGLLHGLTEVGRCMALTRNEQAVSEVRGCYGGVELGAHAGQVIGDAIDLRVFLAQWKHAFALREPERRSIHVFDGSGTAVHKIYLEPEGDEARWDALVAKHAADLPLVIEPAQAPKADRPDAEVDVAAMTAAWDAMTDTHEFFHLLLAHRVGRVQALRLAGSERAYPVMNEALSLLLQEASGTGDRIMIFIGNRGCIQIFSGPVKRIVRKGPWLNVLDPGFNLHLREDLIATSWVVRKPTKTGIVSSLELYDAAGNTIALVFRKRDDREQAEDAAWSDRLARLPGARA